MAWARPSGGNGRSTGPHQNRLRALCADGEQQSSSLLMSAWAPRRIAITGIGAITALGNDRDSTWRKLIEGATGISAITAWSAANYPTKIAGEIRGFDPL